MDTLVALTRQDIMQILLVHLVVEDQGGATALAHLVVLMEMMVEMATSQ